MTYECYSQTYTFLFVDQFANTVFLKTAEGYCFAKEHYGDKGINLQIKSRKKLSEKLLCDVWVQLTELQLYIMELFASPVFVESENL